jgi:hypothetical protein
MARSSAGSSRALRTALSLCSALAACSHSDRSSHGSGADDELDASYTPTRTRTDARAAAQADAHTDAQVGGFRAQLGASSGARVLCRGACTELTATAEQGAPPYTFSFDQGIGDGPGPHRVCPEQTTTYQVRVSDSSFAGEFGGENPDATARITIEVSAACSDDAGRELDAGGASDGAVGSDASASSDAGPGATGPGKPFCTKALARIDLAQSPDAAFTVWFDDFDPSLVATAQDELVFAVPYQGTIKLMDGSTLDGASGALLVGKLSSRCEPVWFKSLTARRQLYAPSLAVDSRGRIVIVATTRQDADSVSSIYLTALDPAGERLWEQFFDGTPVNRWRRALRTDANDDIALMTAAAAGTNFGGGALGTGSSALEPISVLAKFRGSNGSHVWSKLLAEVPTHSSLAIQNGTDLVFHGWSDLSRNWGAGGRTTGSTGAAHGYLARADAAGNYVWSLVASEGLTEQSSLHWLDVNRAGQLVLSNFALSGELALTNSNAQVQWKKRVIDPAVGRALDWNKTALDGQNIFVGGSFEVATAVNGVALQVRQSGGRDSFVQKLDVNGELRWTYQSDDLARGAASGEVLAGLAADSQGNAYALIKAMSSDEQGLWLVGLSR